MTRVLKPPLVKPYSKEEILRIMRENASNLSQGRPVYNSGLLDFDWYPSDETQLAYSRDGLWLITAGTYPDPSQQFISSKFSPKRLVYSPNGRYLLIRSDSFKLLDVANDYSEKEFPNPPSDSIDNLPIWSPDGKEIIYQALKGELWLVKSDGQDRRKISDGVSSPVWVK